MFIVPFQIGNTTELASTDIFVCNLSHAFLPQVGFFNLAKQARDQMNHLWVAEATENSTYRVSYNLPSSVHLKEAADSAQRWAKESYWVRTRIFKKTILILHQLPLMYIISVTYFDCLQAIQKLRERVLCIVGGHGS